MRAQLIGLLNYFRGSYWFIPSLMVIGAILFALASEWLDSRIGDELFRNITWLYESEPAGARAVLSAIATSMIGVAGVTFSMTIVTVAFAASNIGPRLIGNFMRDTGNQVTLGTFIATFVYCLLILRTVTDPADANTAGHVPHLSLTVALLLAMLCIINLIYFIHHIPESINVAKIAHEIAQALHKQIDLAMPVGDKESGPSAKAPKIEVNSPEFRVASEAVALDKSGYIQLIDLETLVERATNKNAVVRIEYRPGDFYVAGATLIYVWPGGEIDSSEALQLADSFVIGAKRTGDQDLLFLVDQLVEILMRALSPGINDSFTAVSCLDWVQSILASIVRRPEASANHFDAEGQVRVVLRPVSLHCVLESVFAQPLQYIAADRIASMRMMEVIAELLGRCQNGDHKLTLLEFAERLKNAGEKCLPVKADQHDLSARYDQVVQISAKPEFADTLRDKGGWLGGQG